MRDPQSSIIIAEDQVVRYLRESLPDQHPLCSKYVNDWVTSGLLIPFEWLDELMLLSPKIPFVSSPEEWCDEQLLDAALLTLDLLEKSNEQGADMKDASAWNVIFDGCKPVFCDLTSLEPIKYHAWWAAGQFVRHFISPLWLARTTGLQSRDLFRLNREGASSELVCETLGLRRFLNRCWPLVAKANGHATSAASALVTPKTQHYRKQLVVSFRWMLKGVSPRFARNTLWGNYIDQRYHYTSDALKVKRDQVAQWLMHLKPKWTLDLGCNSGEFSQLAIDAGSKVIALDSDHDVVQAMYLKHRGNNKLFPVLSSFDDIHSGRGWAGTEHPGLAQRFVEIADLVMVLALLHHLTISSSVDLEQVARFIAKCTSRWLVIEWVEPSDPQVQLLCAQRRRDANEFSVEKQRHAFINAGFELCKEVSLPQEQRHLALLRKKS